VVVVVGVASLSRLRSVLLSLLLLPSYNVGFYMTDFCFFQGPGGFREGQEACRNHSTDPGTCPTPWCQVMPQKPGGIVFHQVRHTYIHTKCSWRRIAPLTSIWGHPKEVEPAWRPTNIKSKKFEDFGSPLTTQKRKNAKCSETTPHIYSWIYSA